MARSAILLLILAACVVSTESAQVSPVQKVVQLLDDLKAKVVAEGEVEDEQFKKYSSWCGEEADVKEDAITWGKDKKEELEATLEELKGDVSTLSTDIEALAGDVSHNDADMQAAAKIRESEKKEFQSADRELTDTVDTLQRAQSVLKKQLMLAQVNGGKTTAALDQQMQLVASTMGTILDSAFIKDDDKQRLVGLMQAGEGESEDDELSLRGAPKAASYESHSHSILDVLAELEEKAEREQMELRKQEMNSKHAFEMLHQSLTDELSVQKDKMDGLQSSKSNKEEATGIAESDLSTTKTNLVDDQKYYSTLKEQCALKADQWRTRAAERSEELKALEEAKRILSEKFSFMQAGSAKHHQRKAFLQLRSDNGQQNVRDRAAQYLEKMGSSLKSLGLSQLAVRVRAGDDPFGKVKTMIEEMITRLMTQAAEEADQKAWCDEEGAKSKHKRAKLTKRLGDLATRSDRTEAALDKLAQEVSTLSGEVAEMNKAEAEAKAQRTEEHSEYTVAVKEYTEAQDALAQAIQVLTEYYAKSSESFIQVAQTSQDPEFGGPVFDGSYKKQTGSSEGIIGLLEVAASDFAKMESESRATEGAASKGFKELMQENAVARASKQTSIKAKQSERESLQVNLDDVKADRQSQQKELDAVLEYIEKLKGSCQHQNMSFEERSARRDQEVESLKTALSILSGEEPSISSE